MGTQKTKRREEARTTTRAEQPAKGRRFTAEEKERALRDVSQVFEGVFLLTNSEGPISRSRTPRERDRPEVPQTS